MNKIFYQDFLMNFPYDEHEFPKVDIEYTNDLFGAEQYGIPYNLFDIQNGYNRYISFQLLHNATKISFWNKLFYDISSFDRIILIDDININNIEVNEMKDFYLKAYYWNLKQYNKNVYIYKQQ